MENFIIYFYAASVIVAAFFAMIYDIPDKCYDHVIIKEGKSPLMMVLIFILPIINVLYIICRFFKKYKTADFRLFKEFFNAIFE